MTIVHRTEKLAEAPFTLRIQRAASACTLALALSGCGGNASSNSDGSGGAGGTAASTSGNGSGGTTGGGETASSTSGSTTTTGSSSSGSSASATNAATSNSSSSDTTGGSGGAGSGTTTSSTSGGIPELCQLPLASGLCLAYIPSWGFDPSTGHCESFVYGGCGGNDNRFSSAEGCVEVCDPGGLTSCQASIDCTIDLGCCGFSGTATLDSLTIVNSRYSSALSEECQLLDCAYLLPDGIEHFGVRCEAGSCQGYDVRNDALSECSEDSDCTLRNGLGCCEGCGEADWVALASEKLSSLYEGCGDIGCPACAPIVPEGIEAACGADGHCQVVMP